MPFGIVEMRDIILQDYQAWWKRGHDTGKWSQEAFLFMRGPAGCGKTEIMYQIGKILENGFQDLPPLPQAKTPVQLFFNAAMDPESIAGTAAPTRLKIRVPDPQHPGQDKEQELPCLSMHYRKELLLPMQEQPGAILLVDEMGRDAPHMRAAQLKLFSWEKTLAGLDMNHFYIVCAGNPPDENHRVDDIMADAAMAGGRLIPLQVEPKASEWADYMYKRGPTHVEIANFILDNPLLFTGRDDANDASSPYRCPRAWTACAGLLHVHGGGTSKTSGKMDRAHSPAIAMVQGTVGATAAANLAAYMNQDRPMNLKAILTGKFQLDNNGRIADGIMPSAVRSLQHFLQTETMDDTQADNVARFLQGAPADVAHSISRDNRRIQPSNMAKLAGHGAFDDILNRVKKINRFAAAAEEQSA